MAKQLNEEITLGLKELITHLSGCKEGTDAFNVLLKKASISVKKSGSMYFLNKKEVDKSISGMSEKYVFHGFFNQAKALECAYSNYVKPNIQKTELMNRLNIVKFLLCMSERPTKKFLENPEEFITEPREEEIEIDWGAYLKEGLDNYTVNYCESTEDDDDDTSDCLSNYNESTENIQRYPSYFRPPVVVDSTEKDIVTNFRSSRAELLNTVQHSWYNKEKFRMLPFSEWREANIGILWEDFLEEQTMGLVLTDKASILSEYKAIREILWQMWSLHTSSVFYLDRDNIKPKENVTISSVRSEVFESFLYQFIPYMETLEFFRKFSKSLVNFSLETTFLVPQTYRSYDESLQTMLRPVYSLLSDLEEKVREQEITYTLMKLADDLEVIFEPVMLLKKIHDDVVIDFKANTPIRCATVLLSQLHESFQFCHTKMEQDLRITLFIGSLYHYFSVMDAWLTKNDLVDHSNEFLVVRENVLKHGVAAEYNDDSLTEKLQSFNLNVELQKTLDDFCANNSFLKIIRESVYQIGKNLHFLRLLGNYSRINECQETMYEEFVKKSLESLATFFETETEKPALKTDENEEIIELIKAKKYKSIFVGGKNCQSVKEEDNLENLVDTSDGFVMLAFADIFADRPEKIIPKAESTLYEKISKITTTLFPKAVFFENILNDILKERFTISGLMVKNMLIEKFRLEKQLNFLRHIYLFSDDLIFPFYRRFFEKVNNLSQNWGNEIWLTSHLQELLMDAYPEFYDTCVVHVKENWQNCTDSLDACNSMQVRYEIPWPSNIIITKPELILYRDLFQFILKIKWALYTLNHLVFADLEPKSKTERIKTQKKPQQTKSYKSISMKLKYLKFCLTNLLSSIQHYVFSFVFTKCLQKFELDFEKSTDLCSIIASHEDFITSLFDMVNDIRTCGNNSMAFKNVISCVKQLKTMWNRLGYASPNKVNECIEIYKESFDALDVIVSPKYIFDY